MSMARGSECHHRHNQQRTAFEALEVRITGEPMVAGGVVDEQRLAGTFGVAERGQRQIAPGGGLLDGDGIAASHVRRLDPAAMVLVPQQHLYVRGTGQFAEGVGDAQAKAIQIALGAQRLRRLYQADQVEGVGGDPRAGAALR
jgi:hypothetical protein